MRALETALVAVVAAAGCGGVDQTRSALALPAGFRFGTAIAGFQAEMGCPTIATAECEDRGSDWYAWVTTPELRNDASLAIAGDAPSRGPGFYELYEQDLDRAAHELHTTSFRT